MALSGFFTPHLSNICLASSIVHLLGPVGVKHLVSGFPSQLLGKVISMGVYIPLIIRVIGVCSSVVTTPASPAHIRLGTIELVTDATLTEPSPAIHLVLPLMMSLTFLKLPARYAPVPSTRLSRSRSRRSSSSIIPSRSLP